VTSGLSTADSEPVTTAARGSVVVGVDSSAASVSCVEWACVEATALGAPLHIVHGWTWPHLAPWLTSADRAMRTDLQEAGERVLSHCRILARDAGVGTITSEVVEGSASRLLVERSRDAAMVVVGTRRLGPVGRAVLSSTSSAVVGSAACPVLVVHEDLRTAASTGEVVVGVSATSTDEAVMRFGLAYAQRHGRPLRALHCWSQKRPRSGQPVIPGEAEDWLETATADWRADHPDVPVRVEVRQGHPVEGLVDAVTDDGVLIVGRHSHRSDHRRHVGSTSLGVLHHTTSPLIVVPA
jgi:nucleotide-binding universal stress UspA family protein